MDILNFLTTQTVQTGQKPNSGQEALTASPLQGLGFIDLMLARLLESVEGEGTQGTENALLTQTSTDGEDILQSDNPLLDKTPGLDIVKLLAETPEIEEDVKAFKLDTHNEITATLALNQKALSEVLTAAEKDAPLTLTLTEKAEKPPLVSELLAIRPDVAPGDDGGPNLDNIIKRVRFVIAKINRLLGSENPRRAILAHYTPEEFAHLKEKLRQIIARIQNFQQDGGGAETGRITDLTRTEAELQDLLAGLNAQAVTMQEPGRTPSADFATRLNNLNVGEQSKTAPQPLPPLTPEGDASLDETLDLEDGFDKLVKPVPGKKGVDTPVAGQIKPVQHPGANPAAIALQNWPMAMGGILYTTFDAVQNYTDELALGTGNSVTGLSSLTNLVAHTQAASLPHPATQMVAASLQKAASGGENKTMILQLDPPELGRVEVRMEFGKDKSIKAVLTSEKPETHMMLQRDAHALERALQDAGLDVDSSSLSFSLAEDDSAFSHNGGHDGQDGRGDAQNDADGEALIETTMTWHVDPETGHMRYNILA